MRYYLAVPYSEKDEAKALGAKWDWDKKKWYYLKKADAQKFRKWATEETEQAIKNTPATPASKPKKEQKPVKLSDEQLDFIERVKNGHNVLVDACIGSGKTTSIQQLCNILDKENKKILYLTYNTLLKKDAKERITNRNVWVQNYHGIASYLLRNLGLNIGVSDVIQAVIKYRDKIKVPKLDVLIIDEYQDIDQEISEMLQIIKNRNPNMQIVAVGDMSQKIYDKTTLNVQRFIESFLGDFQMVNFTKCFRLSKAFAQRLGNIWQKEINGVNEDCEILQMDIDSVVEYLSEQSPGDVLCLGAMKGYAPIILNELEKNFPEKYNKKTVYATIKEQEDNNYFDLSDGFAVFTTYDKSKGMEREICVVCDFVKGYWDVRSNFPNVEYEILRNLFLVAASRGKGTIIFVEKDTSKDNGYSNAPLSDEDLATKFFKNTTHYNRPFTPNDMFDFKYKESVESCYNLIRTKKIEVDDTDKIEVKRADELIDLSPCIGIMQEASFFEKYNIDEEIERAKTLRSELPKVSVSKNATISEKILYLTAINTGYARYTTQVEAPFMEQSEIETICNRLSTVFSRSEVDIQVDGAISLKDSFEQEELSKRSADRNKKELEDIMKELGFKKNKIKTIIDDNIDLLETEDRTVLNIVGRADVVKDNVVYELKFKEDLRHEDYLQLAAYLILLRKKKGILWNVCTNMMMEVTIPDEDAFIKQMIKTITKGAVNCSGDRYYLSWMSKEEEFASLAKKLSSEIDENK